MKSPAKFVVVAALLSLGSTAYGQSSPKTIGEQDQATWQQYDANGDSMWSSAEFDSYFHDNYDFYDSSAAFDAYDSNNDGMMSFSEYQAGMCCS